MIDFIKYTILRMKKPKLEYPIPFAIVNYTEVALQKNTLDVQNKIILKYFQNKFGNIQIKKYKYSQAMVNILEKDGIPVYDKTERKQRFPVFVEEIPGEIIYTK